MLTPTDTQSFTRLYSARLDSIWSLLCISSRSGSSIWWALEIKSPCAHKGLVSMDAIIIVLCRGIVIPAPAGTIHYHSLSCERKQLSCWPNYLAPSTQRGNMLFSHEHNEDGIPGRSDIEPLAANFVIEFFSLGTDMFPGSDCLGKNQKSGSLCDLLSSVSLPTFA